MAEKSMRAIWKIMEDRDFKVVHAVWDANEKVVKPEYTKMYNTVNGTPMEEVKPIPFAVQRSDGSIITLGGGYAHLSYDTRNSGRFPDMSLNTNTARRGMNTSSHGAERVHGGLAEARPLNLDLLDVQRDMLNALYTSQFNVPLYAWDRLLRCTSSRPRLQSRTRRVGRQRESGQT